MTERSPTPAPTDAARLDACINGLRGEPSDDPGNLAQGFGLLVRELALAEELAVKTSEAQAEDELIERWREQGLLNGHDLAEAARQPAWWHGLRRWTSPSPWWALALPSGAVAVLAVLLWPAEQRPLTGSLPDDEAGAMRGAEQAQRLVTAEPAALASRLEQALRSNGLLLRRVNLPSGSIQIQALVPEGKAAAKSALESLGVVVPSHGRVDVLVVKGP